MAISITVSDLVRFKVTGSINDEHGAPQPFDFWLTMQRLKDTAEVQAYWKGVQTSESQTALVDALTERARDWYGVNGSDGKPLPFSVDNVRALMSLPGLAFMTNTAFLRESGAKEKN